ncbi:MAG: NAD(P)H-dependent oxidoreductase [Pseudomonadota bacterium]
MAKRIYVLNGHPAEASLSRHLAETYWTEAAGAGHDVRIAHVNNMHFDMDRGAAGYSGAKALEPVLEEALSNLEWCEHFVLTSPMWWGGLPAKLKGLIDRSLLPGRTFSFDEKTSMGLPKPLLSGRTARVILTADTPGFFLRLAYGNAIKRQLRGQILGFVGFKPIAFSYLAPASHPKDGKVEQWTKTVRGVATKGV